MWSFAIILGRALGFWCEAKRDYEASLWLDKLAVLGGGDCTYNEPAQFSCRTQRRWYQRISFVAEAGYPPKMCFRMLVTDLHRATAAYCKTAPPHEFTKRPMKRWRRTVEAQAEGG